MNLMQMRAAALKAAQDIIAGAKAGDRDLTDGEQTIIEAKFAEVEDLDAKIEKASKSAGLMDRVANLGGGDTKADDTPEGTSTSLGEHFIKHAGARLQAAKGMNGVSVAAPEFKAATSTHTIGSVFQNPVLTQFDRTIVPALRPQLTIADLLGVGTIGPNNNAVSYFIEGALEGAYTTVAEGAAKPQLHFADPTLASDALKKIAGFIKLTDEMMDDLDFLASEINNRLLYELAKFEEAQLLNGAGTGTTVQGLLNRSGIQTETGATIIDNADAVFRAMTKVSTGSGLDADGIVIHPTDYQTFRLKKDVNNQYYGGGFFTGEYGVGGVMVNPPLWGLRTVVTTAIAAGTCLVGAFNQSTTVYRKGGVRVESTNSHVDDFTNNLVTVRAEERIALAVRRPTGLVKLTLGTT